jgi:hypothetical protein
MQFVWQKFHILNQKQAIVVALASALFIALAVALASVPAEGISWVRFLGPSRRLDPVINFGSAFLAVPPIFLGYYHLGRLGAFLGLAVSIGLYFVTQVCAAFIFVMQLAGQVIPLQEATYLSVCVLICLLVLFAHTKLSNSLALRKAQRSLRLA